MAFWVIMTYLVSGSICLALAIALLFVGPYSVSEGVAYRRTKNFLAYSALIDVCVDVFALILWLNGKDIFILDIFIIPMSFFVQLLLMAKAIVGLLQTTPRRNMHMSRYLIPLVVTTVGYFGGYLIYDGSVPTLSVAGYLEYNTTTFARIFMWILYGLVIAEAAICLCDMIVESVHYLKKLNNYYSGREVINGRRLLYICYCFFGYFLLAAVDFVLSDPMLDAFFMIVNTIIFVSFVIFVFNLQNLYASSLPFETTPSEDAAMTPFAAFRSLTASFWGL